MVNGEAKFGRPSPRRVRRLETTGRFARRKPIQPAKTLERKFGIPAASIEARRRLQQQDIRRAEQRKADKEFETRAKEVQVAQLKAKTLKEKASQLEAARKLILKRGEAALFISRGSEISDEVRELLGAGVRDTGEGAFLAQVAGAPRGFGQVTVAQARARAAELEAIKKFAGLKGDFTEAQSVEALRKFRTQSREKQDLQIQQARARIDTKITQQRATLRQQES